MSSRLPAAKVDGLLVEEFDGELVVYDLDRDRAHCLNPAAAIVFRACDGRTTVREALARLGPSLGGEADPQVLWTALQQLADAHLLGSPLEVPAEHRVVSRRELARAVGAGLSLLPLVVSLAAPKALAAASKCFDAGKPCVHHFDCCTGLMCINGRCQ